MKDDRTNKSHHSELRHAHLRVCLLLLNYNMCNGINLKKEEGAPVKSKCAIACVNV